MDKVTSNGLTDKVRQLSRLEGQTVRLRCFHEEEYNNRDPHEQPERRIEITGLLAYDHLEFWVVEGNGSSARFHTLDVLLINPQVKQPMQPCPVIEIVF